MRFHLAVLLCLPALAQTRIEAGKSYERTLSAGATETFTLDLPAAHAVSIKIISKGEKPASASASWRETLADGLILLTGNMA